MTKLSDLLLVSDIDGTLMNFPAPIPPRNIEALRRFTAAGGRFSVATGRSIASARPYVEQLPVNAPCILYDLNGYYQPLHQLLQQMITMGLSTPARQRNIAFAADLAQIRAILEK